MGNIMIFDWFYSILSRIGLIDKNVSLLLLGVENSGKTTLLNKLKTGSVESSAPTMYPRNEVVRVGNVTFDTHDLAGHEEARETWEQYYETVSAIIFMVDASDI